MQILQGTIILIINKCGYWLKDRKFKEKIQSGSNFKTDKISDGSDLPGYFYETCLKL